MKIRTDANPDSTYKGGEPVSKARFAILANINIGFLSKGTIKNEVTTGFSIVGEALVMIGIRSLFSINSKNWSTDRD